MEISQESIVGELVAQDYRTAAVFKENGIDFCCNGDRSIAEACQQKELESNQVIHQLEEVLQQQKNTGVDYKSWPLDLLADYIEKTHHRYVETKIREITPYLNKIVSVHGEHHPELKEVQRLFQESAGELSMHMKKEELILFPYVRKMLREKSTGNWLQAPFGTILNPIGMMREEHDTEGERFRKIDQLTNHYTPPADACNTYKVTLALLKEFEEDLHLHIHLENNILFPKAIQLEEYTG